MQVLFANQTYPIVLLDKGCGANLLLCFYFIRSIVVDPDLPVLESASETYLWILKLTTVLPWKCKVHPKLFAANERAL
jgi:hypothetical protein